VSPKPSATEPTPSKKTSAKKKRSDSETDLPEDRFINRELSWLEFNHRVLDQACDVSLPLLERAKFLAITSSNLDEFMMVRVGSLKMQYQQNAMQRDPSGRTVSEQLDAVSNRCQVVTQAQYALFRESLEPLMADAGITRIDLNHCSQACTEAADRHFHSDVISVLSPQAIFSELPFPLLQGLGIHVCIRLKPEQASAKPKNGKTKTKDSETRPAPAWDFAVIPLGRTLPRLIPMPSERGHSYVLLEDLVTHYIDDFFPGREVVESVVFRITRSADVELREDDAFDLMVGMEDVLESRRQSPAVRLEFSKGASDAMLAFLSERMDLKSQDLYATDGPIDLTYLFRLHGIEGCDALRDNAWPPQHTPRIDPSEPMFETVKQGDLLLVHPYEQFDPVVRMIEEASTDPDVMAIKQVLYRTSRDSPIVNALKRAAEHGKYVSVIVELKARFDEARNIEWAREMEQAGVQVIYGIRGLKTHAKVCIIVRRESSGIVRYMHFGTGNYNEATANLYSDISLFTCNDEFGNDATAFFTCVTGASQPQPMQHLSAAPLTLRRKITDLIDAETRRSRQGQKAEITAKLNALVDIKIIDALYRASIAGVKIRLNIRGICCLKPGVKGLSETIEVVSIIDRYLEHARIVEFRHGGDPQVFISSADWMPRNLDRRVELLVPVEDDKCRRKLRETLRLFFKDNTNTWVMKSDGSYERIVEKESPFRAQYELFKLAKSHNEAIKQNRRTRFETHTPKP
jgi:polyphosphate kinase